MLGERRPSPVLCAPPTGRCDRPATRTVGWVQAPGSTRQVAPGSYGGGREGLVGDRCPVRLAEPASSSGILHRTVGSPARDRLPAPASEATSAVSQTQTPVPPGLVRLGGTPPLRDYLTQLWDRRQFARENALGELRAQHMDTTLGAVWHLLNPILLVTVYYVVFDLILNATRGVENFIAFLSVGIFAYYWAQKAITGGARSIVSNEGLIRSLQFPRALLPISTVMQETIAFLPGVGVMVAIVVLTGEGLSFAWLMVVPVFLLQSAFVLGAAFITARAADTFRDTLNLLPFLFRLVFYGSGVLYAVDQRFHSAFEIWWVEAIFIANPFYCFISLWRDSLMTTQEIRHIELMWLSATAWSIGLLLVGLLIFRAGEKAYGRG
jgi:teichoic acid transport system permease protein